MQKPDVMLNILFNKPDDYVFKDLYRCLYNKELYWYVYNKHAY